MLMFAAKGNLFDDYCSAVLFYTGKAVCCCVDYFPGTTLLGLTLCCVSSGYTADLISLFVSKQWLSALGRLMECDMPLRRFWQCAPMCLKTMRRGGVSGFIGLR